MEKLISIFFSVIVLLTHILYLPFCVAANNASVNGGKGVPSNIFQKDSGMHLGNLSTKVREKISQHLQKAEYEVSRCEKSLPSGQTIAYRAFNRALSRIIMEEPDEMRLLELSRLDRIQIEIYRNATQGQLGAVDRYLKIAERRAKLMGIDAAERVEHAGIGGGPIQVREVIIRGPADDE